MTRNSPKRIILIVALSIMATTGYMKVTEAASAQYTIKLCEKNFIGTTYKPHLEAKCGLVWQKLTYEVMQSFNQK